MFIEQDLSAGEIIKATCYDSTIVDEILAKVARNEYKRDQSAIGPRMSSRFWQDRYLSVPHLIQNEIKENASSGWQSPYFGSHAHHHSWLYLSF